MLYVMFIIKAAPTASGHTDFYYPTAYHDLAEISKIKRMPIPNELIEQYRSK